MLSDECAELLASAPARPERRTLSVEENRMGLDAMAARFGSARPDVQAQDLSLAGVPVRLYRPEGVGEHVGVCLYAHGGGFVLGSLETHHNFCSHLAAAAACTIVSIDYRRPPEWPFPAAVDDVVSVVRAVAGGALPQVDESRLAVAGDSAGGNLCAAAALVLRDETNLRLAALLLPVLDNRPERYASYAEFAAGYSLTADDMTWYFEHYAGPAWRESTHPLLAPMRAKALDGFPPSLVVTAECDVLRDEGEAFAERLAEAGVQVTAVRVEGTFHPFLLFLDDLASAREVVVLVGCALKGALVSGS